MKFGVATFFSGQGIGPAPLAQALEERVFDSLFVTEHRLKAGFDYSDHIRSDRFIKGVRRLGHEDEGFAQVAHGLTADELDGLVRMKPDVAGPPNVEGMCPRFASGGAENLLYDAHWAWVRGNLPYSTGSHSQRHQSSADRGLCWQPMTAIDQSAGWPA